MLQWTLTLSADDCLIPQAVYLGIWRNNVTTIFLSDMLFWRKMELLIEGFASNYVTIVYLFVGRHVD